MQVDLKQFEGMAVATARKNKEEEEDALDLKNKRGPKTLKEKPLKEVAVAAKFAQMCAVHDSSLSVSSVTLLTQVDPGSCCVVF